MRITKAFYITPSNEKLIKEFETKVPVVMVEYGTEGYYETEHTISFMSELIELNKNIGATIQDAFVLSNLSMFPNGNVEKLYEIANRMYFKNEGSK